MERKGREGKEKRRREGKGIEWDSTLGKKETVPKNESSAELGTRKETNYVEPCNSILKSLSTEVDHFMPKYCE